MHETRQLTPPHTSTQSRHEIDETEYTIISHHFSKQANKTT